MQYVYVITEDTSYGDKIIGVCSSEELAHKTVEGIELSLSNEYGIHKVELDAVARSTANGLGIMMEEYSKIGSLYDELKGLL